MEKRVVATIGCLFIWSIFSHNLFASPAIKILTSTPRGPAFILVDIETMQASFSTINAIDPNFQKDGLSTFTGITLKRLFSISGILSDEGVTIIGSDQYVAYIPRQMFLKDQALLSWSVNGKQITSLNGGPLKIIFPTESDIHGSCYVWYVDTIIAGSLKTPFFQMIHQGTTQEIRIEDISSGIERLDEKLFSIPAGCRNGMETKTPGKVIQAVTLNRLMDLKIGKQVNQVTFVPFAGSSIRIKKQALTYPIYITLSFDGKPIHPAIGGPFSVMFPVEVHRDLAGMVPESGALFFLEKIIIE